MQSIFSLYILIHLFLKQYIKIINSYPHTTHTPLCSIYPLALVISFSRSHTTECTQFAKTIHTRYSPLDH